MSILAISGNTAIPFDFRILAFGSLWIDEIFISFFYSIFHLQVIELTNRVDILLMSFYFNKSWIPQIHNPIFTFFSCIQFVPRLWKPLMVRVLKFCIEESKWQKQPSKKTSKNTINPYLLNVLSFNHFCPKELFLHFWVIFEFYLYFNYN